MENKSPNITQEQEDLFDRYLMQGMSDGEKEAFERQLATDPELQISLKAFKETVQTIEESALKDKLEVYHSEFSVDDSKVVKLKKPKKTNYLIAASIAALICLGGLWFFKTQNQNQNLFDEYFEPDPGLPTVMGNSDNYDFYTAMVDYKQGNYELAIEKWEALHLLKPQNDTLNYFLGSALLANGNEIKAINYLEKSIKNGNSPFKTEAYYYLGLSYLKIDSLKAAKKNLGLSEQEKASSLLSELKE